MRPIDADALKDEIAVLFERNPKLIDGWLAYAVEDTIDDAPTIAPVKHGRWVMQGTAYGCSLCGEGVIHPFHNYCPNCGARMEGEEG